MARLSRRSMTNIEMSEHEMSELLNGIRDIGSYCLKTSEGPINIYMKEISMEMAVEIDRTMKEISEAILTAKGED